MAFISTSLSGSIVIAAGDLVYSIKQQATNDWSVSSIRLNDPNLMEHVNSTDNNAASNTEVGEHTQVQTLALDALPIYVGSGGNISDLLSTTRCLIAIANNRKHIFLVRSEPPNGHLIVQSSIAAKKQVTALKFMEQGTALIVSDRAGNLTRYRISEADGALISHDVIAGTVSMLLDIAVSSDGHLLAVCDRDERIRISFYPNAYNIHSFCLGHREYIRCIEFILTPAGKQLLVSISGDSAFKVWDVDTGTCLDTVDLVLMLQAPSNDQANMTTVPEHLLVISNRYALITFEQSGFVAAIELAECCEGSSNSDAVKILRKSLSHIESPILNMCVMHDNMVNYTFSESIILGYLCKNANVFGLLQLNTNDLSITNVTKDPLTSIDRCEIIDQVNQISDLGRNVNEACSCLPSLFKDASKGLGNVEAYLKKKMEREDAFDTSKRQKILA